MQSIALIGIQGLSLLALIVGVAVLAKLTLQRVRLSRKLEQADEMLTHAEELGRIGIWTLDLDSADLSWSDRVFEIHHRSPEKGEPDADESLSMYHPEDSPRLQDLIKRSRATGRPFSFVGRLITETGEVKQVIVKGETSRGFAGDIERLYGVIMESDHILQMASSQNDNIGSGQLEESGS